MEQKDIFVKMALHAWNVQITRTEKLISHLTDEQLAKEVAPGKNTIGYLLGHLIAVNEGMITIFGLGDRKYAHLDEPFVKNPDRSGMAVPTTTELREYWRTTNEELTALFEKMTAEEWLDKHTLMTDEDLAKDPARNKMSVLLGRTSHVAYHLGQMVLAK